MKIIRVIVLLWFAGFAVTGAAAQSATPDATGKPGLPGSSWLLTATSGQDHQTLVLPGSSITLNFEGKDRISGSGGCNGYTSGYTAGEDGKIALSEISSTLRACADTQMTTQESIYLGALKGVTHYKLTERQLTLQIGNVEALHFVRTNQDPLAGTSWKLISEGPSSVTATPEADRVARPVTLTFGAEGKAEGHGGCNSYSTTYTLKDTSLTFRDIVYTQVACEGSNIMQREQNFFAALSSASQYGLTDKYLYLRSKDGSRLAFEKVSTMTLNASPLSGPPGTKITLTGSGFTPSSEIVIGFGPFDGDVYEPIGQVKSDSNGAFTITVTVPAKADPVVKYVFMAAVPGTPRTLSRPFEVTGAK